MLLKLNDALNLLLQIQMESLAWATIVSYGIRIAVRPVEFQETPKSVVGHKRRLKATSS